MPDAGLAARAPSHPAVLVAAVLVSAVRVRALPERLRAPQHALDRHADQVLALVLGRVAVPAALARERDRDVVADLEAHDDLLLPALARRDRAHAVELRADLPRPIGGGHLRAHGVDAEDAAVPV